MILRLPDIKKIYMFLCVIVLKSHSVPFSFIHLINDLKVMNVSELLVVSFEVTVLKCVFLR